MEAATDVPNPALNPGREPPRRTVLIDSDPRREIACVTGGPDCADGRAIASRLAAYVPDVDRDRVEYAYMFAAKAHAGQTRHSGEAYITHPAQVAEILLDLHLDPDTIITALLHDVVEDVKRVRLSDVKDAFGPEVAKLVDGVTKVTQVSRRGRSAERVKQAENLQKFLLAVSSDVRVLLIKLADRLHNMRTLGFHPKPTSKERIAKETLEIYAPLARRIGVHRVCGELEDLAFQHLSPAAYESITLRLSAEREKRTAAVAEVSGAVTRALHQAGLNARVAGREKRPYSVWRKLQNRGVSFEDLADIYAFRVIVEDVDECYRALGLVHRTWRCVPERFKDYISTPKPNNYQSIHTTVFGPDNLRIELQIRTDGMDRIAEDGVAAHWRYKNKSYGFDAEAAKAAGMEDPLARLRPLVEMLSFGDGAEEFLENAKLEMFSDQVFTFTPKGEVIPLPQGATPIDFAYAVHTDVGDTCVGAKVNGRNKPLRTQLRNGDVVEVVRSKAAAPPPNWEELAVTGKAKSAIRRLVRKSQQDEFARIGRAVAEHVFRREGLDFTNINIDDALGRLDVKSQDDLFVDMGRGDISGAELLAAVYPGRTLTRPRPRELIAGDDAALYVQGGGLTPGVGLRFAPCCSPLPGERIVGVLEPGAGVVIHTISCEKLAAYEDELDRWIDLRWSGAVDHAASLARVQATVKNEPGALAEITMAVSQSGGNINSLHIVRRATDFFEFAFDLEVSDARHLNNILAGMRACAHVVAAERVSHPGDDDVAPVPQESAAE